MSDKHRLTLETQVAQSREIKRLKAENSRLRAKSEILSRTLWNALDMAYDFTSPGILRDYWTRHSDTEGMKIALQMIRDNHPDALEPDREEHDLYWTMRSKLDAVNGAVRFSGRRPSAKQYRKMIKDLTDAMKKFHAKVIAAHG